MQSSTSRREIVRWHEKQPDDELDPENLTFDIWNSMLPMPLVECLCFKIDEL